jgi:hypothetical protein
MERRLADPSLRDASRALHMHAGSSWRTELWELRSHL